jgi:uncharacterized protein
MSKPVVEVQILGLAATSGGCAVSLGNEEKVFVIYVEQSVGLAIAMFKQGTQKERPLTDDLLANILPAFALLRADPPGTPAQLSSSRQAQACPSSHSAD